VTKIKIFNNKYYKYLVIAGILWGFYPLIFNQSLFYLSILALLSGRFLVGSAILYLRNKKLKLFNSKKINRQLLVYSLFASIIPLSLFTIGLSLTTPVHASIISLSLPFFVYLFSALIFKDQVHKKVVLGGCLATVGLLIIILTQANDSSRSSLIGDIMVLLSEASSAVATIFARRLIHKKQVTNPDQLAYYDYFIAAIFFSGALVVQILFTGTLPAFGLQGLFWALVAASLGGVIPYLYFLKSAKGLPAEKLADTNYIAPVTGIAAAVLLTGAGVGFADCIGFAAVFTGLAIGNNKLHPIAHFSGFYSLILFEKNIINKSLEFEKVFVESAKSKF
jgi:drug/metabolite transporter (DMT)-like permease